MAETTYDVVGIGNAIVDVIGRCSDDFLAEHQAPKGRMRLVDGDTMLKLYAAMGPAIEISGGSAANTMVGVASFGGKAAFIGKVADDELGRIFGHDISAAGVTYATKPAAGGQPTARSLILVTPDGERTMNTFLGVSPELDHGEVDPDLVRNAKVVYLEGYLFDRLEAKAAFRQAAKYAKEAGRKVALTLSDAFCVDRHRAEFLDLIRADVDILFANEAEIAALYKTPTFDEAARQVRGHTEIAVLTRSAKGSVVMAGDKAVTIAPEPVQRVVDTTGAGDLYAAGFLYGLTAGKSLEICGRLGSIAAAEIISHVGARPETRLARLATMSGL
ncbi:MAG: adenosine kinase [Hyphomicrobiaceae bacterium]|nr:adenosine kinase [Hyphomicrobiaceae bacterium]